MKKIMKSLLCFLLLVNYLSVNAATNVVTNDDKTKFLNDNQKVTSDVLTNDNLLDSSDLLIDNDNDRTDNSKADEILDSQIEDTDNNSDENDDDTDIEDSEYDIKKLYQIIEEEFFKRLSAIEKAFEDEEKEQEKDEGHVLDSHTENSANDTENVTNTGVETISSETVIDSSENIKKSDSKTKKSITENADSHTTEIKNMNNSDNKTSETVLKSTETIENSNIIIQSNDNKSINNSEKVDDTEVTTEKDGKTGNSGNLRSYNGNSITDSDSIDNKADDFDIDNYYDELLKSDFGDEETFEDIITDDDDAYSVVDITLPRDTQFEMIKYEKVQNGRKVVLMKLVPVGSIPAADEDKSGNDKLTPDSAKANVKNKELVIPVKDTSTDHTETSPNEDLNINEKGTRAQNKTLISTDTNTVTGGGDTKESSILKRDINVVSDENIAEDVDDSSATDKSKNISKSDAAEDDGAKWCICYNKLSDIPWVVRMQMGI